MVVDDIIVTSKASLTIQQGTTILIADHPASRPSLPQFDRLDSSCISIRVLGALSCSGRKDKRITFSPVNKGSEQGNWYGIILDKTADKFTEIAYTDIAGAYNGITISNCKPLIRTTLIEFNDIGINCLPSGSARIYNCVIAHNFTTGIRYDHANPVVLNNIIVFNRDNGVLGDGTSKVQFEYNCVYGNTDGNLMDCDPELGVLVKGNKGSDSTDIAHNIFRDPIFAGSVSDSIAVERDVRLQTDKSRIRDTTLAKVLYDTLTDSLAAAKRHKAFVRYALSRYSPCVKAGSPAPQFHNTDGSRNTMGIYGGPEFMADQVK